MYIKFEELKLYLMHRPFFESHELVTLFNEPEKQIMAPLSRWVSNGKLLRLRCGKYMLPAPYQKERASLFDI